jgi:hypothetical protein
VTYTILVDQAEKEIKCRDKDTESADVKNTRDKKVAMMNRYRNPGFRNAEAQLPKRAESEYIRA